MFFLRKQFLLLIKMNVDNLLAQFCLHQKRDLKSGYLYHANEVHFSVLLKFYRNGSKNYKNNLIVFSACTIRL